MQSISISNVVLNIVNNYYNTIFKVSPSEQDIYKKLAISLYSLRNEADAKILEILSDYVFNPMEEFSSDEIENMMKEYQYVIFYCFEHDELFSIGSQQDSLDKHRLGLLHSISSEPLRNTPYSLIELCLSLSQCKEDSEILLPFSGTCQFALCQKDGHYDGSEINTEIWAYSQILLSSQNIDANITLGNSLFSNTDKMSIPNNKQYDYIFTIPPFLGGKDKKSLCQTLLYLAENALKDDGEMYCILPMNFCYSNFWGDLRNIIREKSDTFSSLIIALPPVFAPYSNISTCLFHLSKKRSGLVTLMDATNSTFFSQHEVAGLKGLSLKVQSVIETISKQDKKFVWLGTANDLSQSTNLTPSRYLVPQILPTAKANEKLCTIGELVQLVKKTRIQTSSNEVPLIGMRELSSNYLNCDITLSKVDNKKGGNYVLTEDCLAAGFIGNKFKVGRLVKLGNNNPLDVRSELFSFKVCLDLVTEDFLLRSILSKESETQAVMLASGSLIPRISIQDFLSIKILVPSFEEQYLLCKEDTRKSLTEADRKELETADEFRKDVHMKKHSIGQTIFNLNNWFKVLQKARKEGNGIVDDSATVGKVNKIQIPEIYDNLQMSIIKLQQQISKFDIGYGMQIENIALTVFIEDYIKNHQSPMFRFIYDANHHHADRTISDWACDDETIISVGDPIEYAKFPKEGLSIVLDNIISNACSHGFIGRESTNNYIKVELISDGLNYIISISNNGNSIHEDLTSEDVFTYGRTSQNNKNHFGIGGYEIRKLMREFSGDAVFISDPDENFPVTYKLKFTDTNIESVL